MTPIQLVKIFNWEYKADIGTFLNNLGIKRRSLSESVNNYNKFAGKQITDEKEKYWNNCSFKFSNDDLVKVADFHLLKTHGMYHPVKNKTGVSRDHIVSINEGWENGYDPAYISHPANCRFMLHSDNVKKSFKSFLTYEELINRIEDWEKGRVEDLAKNGEISGKRKPLSEEHRNKISLGLILKNKAIKELNNGTHSSPRKRKTFEKYKWVISNIISGERVEITHLKRWQKNSGVNLYTKNCRWKIVEKYCLKTGERLI
jgi:hypothetical protein